MAITALRTGNRQSVRELYFSWPSEPAWSVAVISPVPTAESLYEAVARALSTLRKDAWVDEIGEGLGELKVRIRQPAVEHPRPAEGFSEVRHIRLERPTRAGHAHRIGHRILRSLPPIFSNSRPQPVSLRFAFPCAHNMRGTRVWQWPRAPCVFRESPNNVTKAAGLQFNPNTQNIVTRYI